MASQQHDQEIYGNGFTNGWLAAQHMMQQAATTVANPLQYAGGSPGSVAGTTKKPRGRPAGSKNKTKRARKGTAGKS